MLFGNLSKFGDGPSKVPFLEQIQANIVSLLLHLNENDPNVVKVAITDNCCSVYVIAMTMYLIKTVLYIARLFISGL